MKLDNRADEFSKALLHKDLWTELKVLKGREDVDSEFPEFLWRKGYVKGGNDNVHILLMCCIIELSRIWEPEFPYQEERVLKAIYGFIMKNMVCLELGETTHSEECYYILKWMARNKNFYIKFLELPNSELLLLKIFKQIFNVLSCEDTIIERELLALATNLIEVSSMPHIPVTFLNITLGNIIIGVRNSCSNIKIKRYSFACEVVTQNARYYMVTLYSVYFDYFILGLRRSNFNFYSNCYEVIYNLAKENYEVTRDIIPLVEVKLKSNNLTERLEVVEFLGNLFQLDLRITVHHKQLWSGFLERFFDKKRIAILCINFVPGLLYCHHELTNDLMNELLKIGECGPKDLRLQVLEVISTIVDEKHSSVAYNSKFWKILKETADDIQIDNRHVCLGCLANVYDKLTNEVVQPIETCENIKWAGNKIISSYLKNDVKTKYIVKRLIQIRLIPIRLTVEERAERLLQLLLSATNSTFLGFTYLLRDEANLRNDVFQTIKIVEAGHKVDMKIINKLSLYFDESETKDILTVIFNDRSQYGNFLQGMKILINPTTPQDQFWRTCSEIINIFEMEDDIISTLLILFRSIESILDINIVKVLMMKIENLLSIPGSTDAQESLFQTRIMDFLKLVAKTIPVLFGDQELLSCLASFVQNKSPAILAALSSLMVIPEAREKMVELSEQHELLPFCEEFLKTGSRKLIKESIRFICSYFSSYEQVMSEIFRVILSNMTSDLKTNVIKGLVAVGHLVLNISSGVNLTEDFIFKVRDMIFAKSDGGSLHVTEDTNWCSKEELPDTVLLKVEALETFVRLLLCLQAPSGIQQNIIYIMEHRNEILAHPYKRLVDEQWVFLTITSAILKIFNTHSLHELHRLCLCYLSTYVSETGSLLFVKLFLKKFTKYLLEKLPLNFIGLYALAALQKHKELTKVSYDFFCLVLQKRKMNGENEVEAIKELEAGVVQSLAFLLDCGVFEAKEVHEEKACIDFLLKPLPLSQPFGFYEHLMNKETLRSSAAPSIQTSKTNMLKALKLLIYRRKKEKRKFVI